VTSELTNSYEGCESLGAHSAGITQRSYAGHGLANAIYASSAYLYGSEAYASCAVLGAVAAFGISAQFILGATLGQTCVLKEALILRILTTSLETEQRLNRRPLVTDLYAVHSASAALVELSWQGIPQGVLPQTGSETGSIGELRCIAALLETQRTRLLASA
jgi:hypothetical protein